MMDRVMVVMKVSGDDSHRFEYLTHKVERFASLTARSMAPVDANENRQSRSLHRILLASS
jgi:hypothetical protein